MAEEAYLRELIGMVNLGDDYTFLLTELWRKEFYSIVPHDENRASDGVELRNKFGFDKINFGPCRVLEVLIGLSLRCEMQLSDSHRPQNAADIFWEFIENLGLNKYSKDRWNSTSVYYEIDDILTRWIERKYNVNGRGGIFPLRFPRKDQTSVELWYQMMNYLIEKGAI